jgi:hypothetical protein
MSKRVPKPCMIPGCGHGAFVYGFCTDHFREFKRTQTELYKKLRRLAAPVRAIEIAKMRAEKATLPKWEYTNDAGEAELAAIAERQEPQKENASV